MSFKSFQQIIMAIQNVEEEKSKEEMLDSIIDNFDSIGYIARLNNISFEIFKRFKKYNCKACENLDNKLKNDYKNFYRLCNKIKVIYKIDKNIPSYESYLKYFVENLSSMEISLENINNGNDLRKMICEKEGIIVNNSINSIILKPRLSVKYKEFNDFVTRMRNFK